MTPSTIPRLFLEEPPTISQRQEETPKSWYRRRSTRGWVAVGLVLALLVFLRAFSHGAGSLPYDPDSTMPNGTKGFVELLQQAGAPVSRDNYPHGDTAVLLYDTLNRTETDRVEQWVEAGGTLIVSDPYSSFQLGSYADDLFSVPSRIAPHCDAAYVHDVRDIYPSRKGTSQFFRHDLNADVQCFRAGKDAYFLEERIVDRGRVLSLGGSEIFTNDRLAKADNAVLLTNLVQPSSTNSITILETRDETSDSTVTSEGVDPGDLYSPQFRDGMWMLLSAGVIFLLWNARRLGRPVEEEPLVRIPASQLIVATGDLLELANQPRAAAAMLRDDLRRSLAERFGVRPDIETSILVDLITQRTGIDPQRIRVALSDDVVTSPESLVVYAQQVERLQMEVKHVR